MLLRYGGAAIQEVLVDVLPNLDHLGFLLVDLSESQGGHLLFHQGVVWVILRVGLYVMVLTKLFALDKFDELRLLQFAL